tara:strand:- start:270 stop:479 length:210 start_codon:yes stop_codon:yes gene_type:complete
MSWKDKRINAINRLSRTKKWSCSDNNPLFEEVMDIYESPAKTREEYLLERKKKNEEVSIFNTIRNKLLV